MFFWWGGRLVLFWAFLFCGDFFGVDFLFLKKKYNKTIFASTMQVKCEFLYLPLSLSGLRLFFFNAVF